MEFSLWYSARTGLSPDPEDNVDTVDNLRFQELPTPIPVLPKLPTNAVAGPLPKQEGPHPGGQRAHWSPGGHHHVSWVWFCKQTTAPLQSDRGGCFRPHSLSQKVALFAFLGYADHLGGLPCTFQGGFLATHRRGLHFVFQSSPCDV